MIGRLKGTLCYIDSASVIIDVSGVGYRVLLAQTLLSKLQKNEKIEVFTHTHVREDLLELYGFLEIQDLRLFEELISVSGVGCKTALNVFSLGARPDIIKAIQTNDEGFFRGVPRLGRKNTQKIIIDLKPKLGGGEFALYPEDPDEKDVVEALKSFGYSAKEAQDAYRKTDLEGKSPEDKIRIVLKYLGK